MLIGVLAGIGTAAALGGLVYLLQRKLQVVRLLAFPLYLGSLAAALKVLSLLEVQLSAEWDRTLNYLLVFLGCVALLRLIGIYFFRLYLPSRRGVRLPSLLPAATMGACYLVTALVIYKMAYPFAPLEVLLTTSAITSLVVGLALQPILGNVFAGIVIGLEKPFRINDWIRLGEHEGRVVAMTWRTTHLRNRDNDNVVLPNSRVADQELINYFYPNPLHLERIYVGAHYRTPPYRVREALLRAAARVPGVLEKPTAEVYLQSFDDSSITYELRIWLEDFSIKPKIASTARMEIWEEFKRQDITIPFPIRTLEIEPRAKTLEIARPKSVTAEEGAPPKARLYVCAGADSGESVVLDGQPVTVGRSSGCDLVLQEGQASKEHLRIEFKDGNYVLTDLHSQYGTRVNGEKRDMYVLRDLDRVRVGGAEIVFELHVE